MRPMAANQHPQEPFNQRLKSRLDCVGVTYRMSFTSNSIFPRPPPRLRTNLRTSTLFFPKFTRRQTSKPFLLSLAGKIQPQMPLETDENLALRQHPSLLWPLMKGIFGILPVSCKATKLQNLAFDPERLRSLVAYYVLAFADSP